MEQNKLAIVIPYFKIDFFEETLKSLEKQTDKRFCVYIGNDNSPKDPLPIIEKNLKTTQYKYIKFPKNIGRKNLIEQWHRCIELISNEEWIMILGDDDLIENNIIEIFYKNLDEIVKKNINVVRYSTKIINAFSEVTETFPIQSDFIDSKISFINKLLRKERSSLSEHIFSRKSYENNLFKDFPVAFGSDDVAWLEFSNFGTILGIKDSFTLIRNSDKNLSSVNDLEIGRNRLKGIYFYNKYILQKHSKHFTKEQRIIIAAKAFNRLRHCDRNNYLELFNFSILLFYKIGVHNSFKIFLNNKSYKY